MASVSTAAPGPRRPWGGLRLDPAARVV